MTALQSDLVPGYMTGKPASEYLGTTERKVALYRQCGLLRWAKLGKQFVYRREWLDEFMETWAGYDMSNREKIAFSINARNQDIKLKRKGH